MNESTFRSLFHEAIGEPEVPAYLSSHARQALTLAHDRAPRRREGIAVLAAVVAVLAVVATLLGPRLLPHVQQPVGIPSPSPSPLAPSPSPDLNACRLPVVVNDASNHARSVVTAGYIDVASGQFTADPSVSLADLPHVAPQGWVDLDLAQYDPVVKRWVPSDVLSPDRRSYVYLTTNGGSSELHVYNVVQRTDQIVWTYAGAISVPQWKQDGIYAASPPYPHLDPRVVNPNQKYWRIDPVTGIATEIDAATFNPYGSLISSLWPPPPTTPWHGSGLSISGTDSGRALYRIGGRDPGTPYIVIVFVNGARADIYSGIQGDQMDFDPYNVWYDGSLLWFSNYDSKYLWSWTRAGGLMRHSIQIPNATGDPVHPVVYRIAGPCA